MLLMDLVAGCCSVVSMEALTSLLERMPDIVASVSFLRRVRISICSKTGPVKEVKEA